MKINMSCPYGLTFSLREKSQQTNKCNKILNSAKCYEKKTKDRTGRPGRRPGQASGRRWWWPGSTAGGRGRVGG